LLPWLLLLLLLLPEVKLSWTAKLLSNQELLCKKIREEAGELCQTLEQDEGQDRAANEMADLLYHSMVLLNVQVKLKPNCCVHACVRACSLYLKLACLTNTFFVVSRQFMAVALDLLSRVQPVSRRALNPGRGG
jgi:phosphoribosyl-ATP pyrophosphohydrolase